MKERKGKFDLTYNQVRSARERWRKIVNDCEWETFDDYLLWMIKSGYQKGMHIGKRNPEKPHGPKNSIWLTPTGEYMAEISCTIPNVGNAFCDKCERNGTDACDGYGCAEWRKWFQENWDKKIHRPIPKDYQKDRDREVFRYEHPDLEREGIVFEGTGSV